MLRRRFLSQTVASLAAVGAASAIAAPIGVADTTMTAVTNSPTTSVWGQPVTATATVSDTTTPASIPTGTVQFSDGLTAIGGPVSLAAGQASIVTSTLEIAQHTISASYTPDVATFDPSNGTASVTTNKADTTTGLGVTPNPAVAGQNATFNATVAVKPPGAGTPFGSVQFSDSGFPFDLVGLDVLGRASTVASAPAGFYTVNAD